MKKQTPNWEIWLYLILYFTFLGGLLYLTKFITPLPYIILIVGTFLCYLIYKEKLTAINGKSGSSVIIFLWFIIFISLLAFLAKPHRYNSYIGKYLVAGKMVTKTVTVEADEGPNTWEERRTYWEPATRKGETIMTIISWFNFALVVTAFILCVKFYSKTKEREDKSRKKSKYSMDFE